MEVIDTDLPQPDVHCEQCGALLLDDVCDSCHRCNCPMCATMGNGMCGYQPPTEEDRSAYEYYRRENYRGK